MLNLMDVKRELINIAVTDANISKGYAVLTLDGDVFVMKRQPTVYLNQWAPEFTDVAWKVKTLKTMPKSIIVVEIDTTN